MMFAQYCRIESKAGGVSASGREMIRAALSLIKPESRYSREYRKGRHEWLRQMLVMHDEARREYKSVVCGRRIQPETRAERDARIRRTMYHYAG
ncbi:MAG: hypothetical protein ACYS7Y_34675 [Planctomycetota bacterium]|jgi:hypothetical protein